MTRHFAAVTHLSDEALIEEVKGAAGREREATARLIALLSELDARRLYLGQGCSSLFNYCTQVLRLSEHAAYGRIEAARAACRFPIVVDLLAHGAVTLTTITLLAPHLTPANHLEVLEQARQQTKRDIERIVARLRPLPDVPAIIQKVPARPPTAVLSPSSAEPDDQTGEPVLSVLGDEQSPLPLVRPSVADRCNVAQASQRHCACAGALQGSAHGLPRDERQAPPRAGFYSVIRSRTAIWRSSSIGH